VTTLFFRQFSYQSAARKPLLVTDEKYDGPNGNGFGMDGRRPTVSKEIRMPLFGSDRNRIKADQTQALSHPTRLRILEVIARQRVRLLSVEALTETLVTTPGFEHVKPDQVNYHRARLLAADLLPAE
jgi:hypothetical protein